jgi:hypothetical protein
MSDEQAVDQRVIRQQTATRSESDREADRAAGDFKKTKDKGGGKLTMGVRVYSPFREYYDGDAFSISGVNATGPFDILPRHHNFISLLSACELIIRPTAGGEQRIVISGGIMHVKADQVIVFLDV